jgi:DedD protein
MERRLKERVIGASVLVMLAVIFIPMVLDDSEHVETKITGTNIPPRPEAEFTSKIVPLPGGDFAKPEPAAESAAQNAEAPAERPPAPEPDAASPAAPVPAVDAVAAAPDRVGLTAWVVQLGSFSSEANAAGLDQRLRRAGYSSFVEPLKQDGEAAFRVRVGPELLRSEAQALRDRIKSELGVDGIVVSYP